MKTSYFYSPNHPSKVCDIAVETVVDSYFKEDIPFHSDIYGIFQNNTIYLNGVIKAPTPIADADLFPKIQEHIGTDYDIVNNIVVEEVETELEERTFGGIYLGYSCNEVTEGIPFEHQEAIGLTKAIYEELEIPIKVQVHINGSRLAISLEHDYEDEDKLESIVVKHFERPDDGNQNTYGYPELYHSRLKKDVIYKSNDSIISTFYGPRAWYGELDYIGSDFLSNKRLSHLIVREIANDWAIKRTLSYCAVEIDYTADNPVPIHFGVKGNNQGIHLENGTFFKFGDIEVDYPRFKQLVIEKLKTGQLDIVEIAKWGFPSTNI